MNPITIEGNKVVNIGYNKGIIYWMTDKKGEAYLIYKGKQLVETVTGNIDKANTCMTRVMKGGAK